MGSTAWKVVMVAGALLIAVAVTITVRRYFVLVLLSAVFLALIGAVLHAGLSETVGQHALARTGVLVLQLLYLLLLFVLALWYWQGSAVVLPPKVNLYCFVPNPVGGVPLEIVWFGALGGVLLSLQGVFRHVSDWNVRYHPWHVARPFVGAGVAVIAYFLLVVTIGLPARHPTSRDRTGA